MCFWLLFCFQCSVSVHFKMHQALGSNLFNAGLCILFPSSMSGGLNKHIGASALEMMQTVPLVFVTTIGMLFISWLEQAEHPYIWLKVIIPLNKPSIHTLGEIYSHFISFAFISLYESQQGVVYLMNPAKMSMTC